MYDVITIGSSTVDVFAKVASELIKIKTVNYEQELIAYPCGTKILISDLDFLPGGGGTNTAVSLSKLGLKVAYAGKVGSDNNSSLILETLKKEKIKFIGVQEKGISGYSIILDSIEDDRTILAYKGVNNDFMFEELDTKKLKTKWFYFSSMVDKSYESLEKLAVFASEKGIRIAFNPSNYLAEKGKLYLKEVLSRTHILILNMEEAMLIVGKHSHKELITELMSLGPKQVIITDGKKGAYTLSGKTYYHVIPNQVKAVETTGAGDAFASTYLAGIIKKKDIPTALRMASLNAMSVIMYRGAKEGLLTSRQLFDRVKRIPLKVIKS